MTTYQVTFEYTMLVESETLEDVLGDAWEQFCDETNPDHFTITRIESDDIIVFEDQ